MHFEVRYKVAGNDSEHRAGPYVTREEATEQSLDIAGFYNVYDVRVGNCSCDSPDCIVTMVLND